MKLRKMTINDLIDPIWRLITEYVCEDLRVIDYVLKGTVHGPMDVSMGVRYINGKSHFMLYRNLPHSYMILDGGFDVLNRFLLLPAPKHFRRAESNLIDKYITKMRNYVYFKINSTQSCENLLKDSDSDVE